MAGPPVRRFNPVDLRLGRAKLSDAEKQRGDYQNVATLYHGFIDSRTIKCIQSFAGPVGLMYQFNIADFGDVACASRVLSQKPSQRFWFHMRASTV
jgi:hypothetical protein